LLASYTGR